MSKLSNEAYCPKCDNDREFVPLRQQKHIYRCSHENCMQVVMENYLKNKAFQDLMREQVRKGRENEKR